MAIVLDDTVNSAPVIQTEISGGICSITLGGLRPINEVMDEAKDLALVLKSGALPAPVEIALQLCCPSVAVTVAPIARAHWQSSWPTPPAAACTRMVSPSRTRCTR